MRALVSQSRRRRIALGRRFSSVAEIDKALRAGALALAAPVATLRRDETRLVKLTQKLMAEYLCDLHALAAKAAP